MLVTAAARAHAPYPLEAPAWPGSGQAIASRDGGGCARPIEELEGIWTNVDRPGEQYTVEGLQITRTDAHCTRHFTIQWDPRGQQWQWGSKGRLSLKWLGNDAIAWVPDLARGCGAHTWRWQRRSCLPRPQAANYRPWRRPRQQHSTEPYTSGPSWQRPEHTGVAPGQWRTPHEYNHHPQHGPHGNYGGRRPHVVAGTHHAGRRLPCGLTPMEANSLLFRELTPEDYELLLRLDEGVAKPTASTEACRRLPAAAPVDFMGGNCTVCQAPFDEHDSVSRLPCGHLFHQDCITRWLSDYRHTCPLCCSEV